MALSHEQWMMDDPILRPFWDRDEEVLRQIRALREEVKALRAELQGVFALVNRKEAPDVEG